MSDHPDERRRLVGDPSLLGAATDEIGCYMSPVIAFRRTVTADTEIGDHRLTEGEKVVVSCGAANLARAEISALFAELLRRVPDLEVSGAPGRWHSTLVDSWKTMPVTFTACA